MLNTSITAKRKASPREHPGRVWLRVASSQYAELWDCAATYYRTARPTRYYHNITHASSVTQRLWKLCASPGPALLLAARWHDAVYVPGYDDNERASARALQHAARGIGIPQDDAVVARAAWLIQRTHIRDHQRRTRVVDPEWAALLDCDLAGLATASYSRFCRTQRGIVAEALGLGQPYGDVPLLGSAKFLWTLLSSRRWIFHTTAARTQWEDLARRNITRLAVEQGVTSGDDHGLSSN